jgi:gamma-glutamylaminecyclotransferase
MTQVFVYGTLKRGYRNHHWLAGQKFVSEARTMPGYTLYALGEYPGMVRAEKDIDGVSGELWQVTPEALAGLDQLEGLAEGLYERVSIKLAAPVVDEPVETYLYLRSLAGHPALGSTWREEATEIEPVGRDR